MVCSSRLRTALLASTSTNRRAVASSVGVVASSCTSTSQRARGPGSRCPRSVPARRRRRTVSGWMPMIAAASGTGTKRVTVGLIPCTVPDQSTASPWHCHGSAGTRWRRRDAPRHAPGRCSISGRQGQGQGQGGDFRCLLFRDQTAGWLAFSRLSPRGRGLAPDAPLLGLRDGRARHFRVLPLYAIYNARARGCGELRPYSFGCRASHFSPINRLLFFRKSTQNGLGVSHPSSSGRPKNLGGSRRAAGCTAARE